MDSHGRGTLDTDYVPRHPVPMQGTNPPTFRPTVWPAEPPRVPKVTRPKLEDDPTTGGFRVVDVLGEVDLPPDFVFQELLDLKPDTAEDARHISEEWGLASGTGVRSFDYLAGEPPALVAGQLARWESETGRHLVHPGAVDIHLRTLRRLAGHLLAYLEDRGDEALLAAWESDGGPRPDTAGMAWFWWETYLNRGLAAFTVHVRTNPATEALLSLPAVTLYNACCLQLAQYLATEAQVSRCANERCRKPFTRQRGRARDDYGQHRSRGVRYCSHLCAKAQSERDRRRRRAEEGQGS